MGIIIAIDFGEKRTGIAATDPLQLIASGLTTVPTEEAVPFLTRYCSANTVDTCVIGLPKQMDNTPSEVEPKIKVFIAQLSEAIPSLTIVRYDERFTSKMATQSMLAGGLKKQTRKNKALVDKISATLLLQSYLDASFARKEKPMILPIVAYGSPVLKKKAKAIPSDFDELDSLIANMWETMYAASGVGLAAPQVGRSLRLFVIDASPFAEDDSLTVEEQNQLKGFKKVFINATIEEESGPEWAFSEGCLSIPDVREDVKRKEEVVITYQNQDGSQVTETYHGLAARVIQHEYDHIEGILFTDKLSPLKKRLIKGKLTNISKGKINPEYKMKFPLQPKKR